MTSAKAFICSGESERKYKQTSSIFCNFFAHRKSQLNSSFFFPHSSKHKIYVAKVINNGSSFPTTFFTFSSCFISETHIRPYVQLLMLFALCTPNVILQLYKLKRGRFFFSLRRLRFTFSQVYRYSVPGTRMLMQNG